MTEWAICANCSLRHTARADGTCPRCKMAIGPAAGSAGAGWGPVPGPGAYAAVSAPEPEGTWLGGCVAGFVLGLLGLIVAYIVGKPMTKQGARTGFVTRLGIAFVVVAFVLVADPGDGRRGGAQAWTTYRSPAGYSVELPGVPIPKTDTVISKTFGKMVVHFAQPKDLHSEAGHFDMPDGFNFIPADVFGFMIKDIFDDPATVLSTKHAPLGRNAGTEYTVEIAKRRTFCKVRFAAVNRRIIYVYGCSKDRNSEVVNRVPASLRLDD